MPKAPWNSGLCKVCNTDKDDDLVLFCDVCDGEDHTYCLSSPLGTVPQEKWYCPYCISPESLVEAVYASQLPAKCHIKKRRRGSSEASEDEIGMCKVCGVAGYGEALISCHKCEASFVHCYCALVASLIFAEDIKWECEDCVPLYLKKHMLKELPVQETSGSSKPKGTPKERRSGKDSGSETCCSPRVPALRMRPDDRCWTCVKKGKVKV